MIKKKNYLSGAAFAGIMVCESHRKTDDIPATVSISFNVLYKNCAAVWKLKVVFVFPPTDPSRKSAKEINIKKKNLNIDPIIGKRRTS